jgi:hypothetical protein
MFAAPRRIIRGKARWVVSTLAVMSTSWGWARLCWYPIEMLGVAEGVYLEIGFPGIHRPFVRWLTPSVSIQVTQRADWRCDLVFELRKREENGEVPKFIDDFEDAYFAKLAPAVGKTLFCSSFPDGTVRDTGFLSVWRSPEGITVKLQDSEAGAVWQFTAESFEKALKLIEKALQEGKPGNRSTKARAPRRKVK